MEAAFYRQFTKDAAVNFAAARDWLSEPDYQQTIHNLAVVQLQKSRLSALIAEQGFTQPKVAPNGIAFGVQLTLSAGRYDVMLDNRFSILMERLLTAPLRESISTASSV